ncbi:MAG: hypothetical protein NTW96_09670 [Planctomycetia bacterium]|nr:hypothetical protein [Planctomycetia bacterium]
MPCATGSAGAVVKLTFMEGNLAMNAPASETAPRRRQRRWYQYSLATLLVVVTLVAVLLSTYHTYVKLNEPATSVFLRKWGSEIYNGESIDRVQAVLGPARAPEDTSWIVDHIRSDPDSYPDGLEKGDRFILYEVPHGRTHTMTVYVQFRNDRLVNHVPSGIQVVHFAGP